MKSLFVFIASLSVASLACAEDSLSHVLSHFPQERAPLPEVVDVQVVEDLQLPTTRKSSLYFRLGGGETTNVHILPGMGIGFRWASGLSAIDLSTSYTRQLNKNNDNNYLWTIPKVSYLRYLDNQDQSFYAGAGLGWGHLRKRVLTTVEGVETTTEKRFDGVIPHFLLGYELGRTQKWCSFFELSVSQPALPLKVISSVKELPGPFAELMVGLGF